MRLPVRRQGAGRTDGEPAAVSRGPHLAAAEARRTVRSRRAGRFAMKGPRFLLVMGTVLTAVSLSGAPAAAEDSPGEPVLVTPKDDPHPDLDPLAKSMGWTLDQAAAQLHAADVVGSIATDIAKERPEIFVGSALSKTPGGAPTLYVKGLADAFVRDLVAASDIEIVLADKQPYSFDELEARKSRVHQALVAAGFRNVVTGANISGGGIIPAAVAMEPGLPTASHEILAAVPDDLRSSVVLTVSDPSGFRDTNGAWAGMWTTIDGANDCTSGWTVRRTTSGGYTFGVTTAGHCSGNNGIYHPGYGSHSFVFQSEHRGAYGDVEWHTTNVTDLAQFYASSSTVRPALYLEPRSGISRYEPVCQYGRSSNSRDCLEVYDVSIECTLNGFYNNRLVQMDRITTLKGDSGGPWFYDYKAYGSQKGWCNSRDAWTVADLYDEALNVSFVIYE